MSRLDGTYTTANDGPTLTLAALQEALDEIYAMLPRLLYHCSEYAPRLGKDGEPVFCKMPSTIGFSDPILDDVFSQEYILLHPDNLPYLKVTVAGTYRLEPLIKTAQKE
jgi:hypothetical protein